MDGILLWSGSNFVGMNHGAGSRKSSFLGRHDLLYTQWIYSLDQGLNLWACSLICQLRGFAALLSLLLTHWCLVTWKSNELIVDSVNTLRTRQNGCHFQDGIFKWIFLNENVWILIKILLKFVPRCLIDIIQALVPIMAWRQSGNKPLSELMMVRLPTHICVTRPQWLNVPPDISK